MRRHPRRRNVISAAGALAIAGVALWVGGGWGIVIFEAGAVLVVVIAFVRNMNKGDGDAAG